MVDEARSEDHHYDPITVDQVDRAAASFWSATGQGPDAIGPDFVIDLPRAGRQRLAEILTLCDRAVAWP